MPDHILRGHLQPTSILAHTHAHMAVIGARFSYSTISLLNLAIYIALNYKHDFYVEELT